jgi:hypothetical protein
MIIQQGMEIGSFPDHPHTRLGDWLGCCELSKQPRTHPKSMARPSAKLALYNIYLLFSRNKIAPLPQIPLVTIPCPRQHMLTFEKTRTARLTQSSLTTIATEEPMIPQGNQARNT